MLFKGIAYIDALYILSELRVGLFNAFLFNSSNLAKSSLS